MWWGKELRRRGTGCKGKSPFSRKRLLQLSMMLPAGEKCLVFCTSEAAMQEQAVHRAMH